MKTHIQPWTVDLSSYPESFGDSIVGFCGTLLSVVYGLESAMRQFHPPRLPEIQKALQPFAERLESAGRDFEDVVARFGQDQVSSQLQKAAQRAAWSLDHIMRPDSPQAAIMNMLKAMRQHCRAQELLYPLIITLKPVGRYFLETAVRARVEDFTTAAAVSPDIGLFLSVLLTRVIPLGLLGISIGFSVDWVARAGLSYLRFRKGHWKTLSI